MSTTPSLTAEITLMSTHTSKSMSMGTSAKSTPAESRSKPRSTEYGTIPIAFHHPLQTITFPLRLLPQPTITKDPHPRQRPLNQLISHESKTMGLRIILDQPAVPHQRPRQHQVQLHRLTITPPQPTPRPTRPTLSLEKVSWESRGINSHSLTR